MPRKYVKRSPTPRKPTTPMVDEAGYPAPARPLGYADRMLRPEADQIGTMISAPWAGRPHWVCPKCSFRTFDRAQAASHKH